MSYILHFFDSARFMTSLLPNIDKNHSEGINRIKCKFGHGDLKCKTCGIRCKYCKCFLEYKHFKDYLMKYICLRSKIEFLQSLKYGRYL